MLSISLAIASAWSLAALLVVFPVLDMAPIVRSGISSDHMAAFRIVAGEDFSAFQTTGRAAFVRQLEYANALH